MNITRLLKLYKQHYLKSYEDMAEKEYSCWGYFDCMEVDLVKSRAERGLLMRGESGDMADLWYASANATEELSGHYGQQNIGLFRYETEQETIMRDQEFWKEENKDIILIACMIQVKDHYNVNDIMADIEQTISDPEYRSKNIYGITYRTFDNFDILLFLKGNSYIAMSEVIDKVGEREDIRYKYSVCGIAQKYLDKVSENTEIHEIEYNGKQLVNDKIAEVWLEIISDGKVDLNNLSADLEEGTEYARVLGYIDNTICIRNTNMWNVVRLFRGGNEGITHKNGAFGNGIYNISTVILPAWEKMEGGRSSNLQSSSNKTNGWCMEKIRVLRQHRNEFGDDKNEVLYSNWLALIRVLNVLSQFENSLFSKDIFRIIFPSMKLICHKFEDILEHYDAENFMKQGYDSVLIIERYINDVDGIIHHLIHTSQAFMTIPGYSGSLYDIPTKMLTLYMAYAYKIIATFNDSDQNFACFICPLLNSKPEVQEIETKAENEILLDIRLAQRHLYMPRAFIVILSHEIYHYIGNESRSRKTRANHLIKMCVYALTYLLLNVKEDFNTNFENFSLPIKPKEKEIQEYLIKTIPDAFKEKNEVEEKAYSSETLQNLMTDSCYAVLYESKYGLDETLRQIQMENWQEVEDLKKALSQWSDFLKKVEKNKKRKMTRDSIERIVDQFIYSFQEIYADLSSIICLELELKYYFEAILVSEGMMLDKDYDSILVINRLAVVVYTLTCASDTWKTQWEKMTEDETALLRDLIVKIEEYIKQMTSKNKPNSRQAEEFSEEECPTEVIHEWPPYFYLDGVWYEQVTYAETCIANLQKEFSDTDEKKQCIKVIRDTFEAFKMHDSCEGKSYSDWFNNYDNLIREYNSVIDEMVDKEMQ